MRLGLGSPFRMTVAASVLALLGAAGQDARQPSEIRGVVTDLSGKPVVGALVKLIPNESRQSWQRIWHKVRSQADGSFRMEVDRRGGEWLARAEAEPFAPSTAVAAPGREFRLRLGPGASVEGRVVDSAGRPIEGAAAMLFSLDSSGGQRLVWVRGRLQGEFEALSGADGAFRIEGVPLEPFTLAVDHAERPFQAGLEVRPSRHGQVVDAGAVALPDGWTLKGIIRDDQGRPLPGVQVTKRIWGRRGALRFWSSLAMPDAITDRQGRFAMKGLGEGESAFLEIVKQGYVAGRHRLARTEDTVELSMSRGYDVQGVVLGPDGQPAPGLQVQLAYRRESGQPGSLPPNRYDSTNEDGRFLIRDAAAGSAYLTVRAPGLARHRQGPFEVARGADLDFLIRLEPGHTLRGRVFLPSGEPAPSARVSIAEVDESGQPSRLIKTVRARADGSFEIDGLAKGRLLVVARAPSQGTSRRQVDIPARGPVEIRLAKGVRR